jgi:hypothetical protein
MKQAKIRKFWGVTYVNSPDVMPDTIRRTREESIKACCGERSRWRGDANWRFQWQKWRKAGCRTVRVMVEVLP